MTARTERRRGRARTATSPARGRWGHSMTALFCFPTGNTPLCFPTGNTPLCYPMGNTRRPMPARTERQQAAPDNGVPSESRHAMPNEGTA